MNLRYIPALIMLIAGAITSILNIYNKVELLASLRSLLFVLVIFYIIGLIVKAVIKKAMTLKPDSESAEKDQDAPSDQENTDNTEAKK